MPNKVNKSNFRSYDIRGEYPTEIDETTAYAIAIAYAKFNQGKKVIIGHDHRDSLPPLKEGFIKGLTESGVDVIDIGQVTTDTTYFASWFYSAVEGHDLGLEGAVMITASHLPAQFNGFKFITKDLKPIGKGIGMEELYDFASQADSFTPVPEDQRGTVSTKDVMDDYLNWVWSFVDKEKIKPLKVVMDPGNGVAGPTIRKVFEPFGLEITEMFFEPDATFPNHDANPLIEENRLDIMKKVKEVKPDLGIAWDADADRCYFIDENGDYVHGDFATALLAKQFIKEGESTGIVYDVRASRVVANTIQNLGGRPLMEKVGHAHIKKRMRDEGAVFGGEVSGHYYFEANHYMDNGFIPALIVLQLLSESGKPLSEFIKDLGEYHVSGEINSEVEDREAVLVRLKETYNDGKLNELDGVLIEYNDWRFSVRPSNTDPVIRLNLEASSKELMEQKTKEVLQLIRKTN